MPYDGSERYAWDLLQTLGKGTSGEVFLGYHKKTAKKCAVKVFKPTAHKHTERELGILAEHRLKHRNIVEVLGIEQNRRSGDRVLILEYCKEGSLSSLLKKPQYLFGLPEEEVRNFLIHMRDATGYLRDIGVIHRDYKPGNVMCCRGENGSRLYKLADFGTSAVIGETAEEFQTLHGTLEYMHPTMVRDFVSKQHSQRSAMYSTKSDLWSFGVMLYQTITGRLPFTVHGGRTDKAGIGDLLTRKPRGAIAGNKDAKGQITWERWFPARCRLSLWLQRYLYKLLCGLLEDDTQQAWDYQQFFQYVDDLRRRNAIYVFSVVHCLESKLYLTQTDTIAHLKEQVAQIMDIRCIDQVLLYGNELLHDIVSDTCKIQHYPQTSQEKPIYVLVSSDEQLMESWTAAPYAEPTFAEFSEDGDTDKKIATEMYGTALLVSRDVSEMDRATRLLNDILFALGSIVDAQRACTKTVVYLLQQLLGHIQNSIADSRRDSCPDTKILRLTVARLKQTIEIYTETMANNSEATAESRFPSALWHEMLNGTKRGEADSALSDDCITAMVDDVEERYNDVIKSSNKALDSNERQILHVDKFYIRKSTRGVIGKASQYHSTLRRKHDNCKHFVRTCCIRMRMSRHLNELIEEMNSTQLE